MEIYQMIFLMWKLTSFLLGILDYVSLSTMPCGFNPLCSCVAMQQEISCVSVPFLVLPKLPFKEVYQLTFARNGLPVLSNKSLDGTAVSSLRLMYNDLVTLPLHAFHRSEQLMTSLDISYNQMNEFPAKALRKLPYLQWLNLHFNKVEELRRSAFENLWSRSSLRSLLLSNNHVSFIEDGVFRSLWNLSSLDLSNNHISKLEGQPFPDSLTTLSLSENLLDWIPPDALSNLKYLNRINLGGNLFSTLPKKWKLSVRHLDKLDFSHNLLADLDSNIFNGSFSVSELSLSYNYLRTLPMQVFRGLSIQRLSLTNNRLSSIPVGTFEGLESTLTALDLSFNMLNKYPKALKELNQLQQLHLRGNQLEDLDRFDLYTCREHLETLDLSRNVFKKVPKEALKTCKTILRLSLQDNQIKRVYANDFYGWGDSLLFLSLANNDISYIAEGVFLHTPKLREVKLSYNNLVNGDPRLLLPLRHSLKAVELGSLFGLHRDPPDLMVKFLNNIEWLQMDHNNISDITPTSLLGLTKLVHCDLEGNNIRLLPHGLFPKNVHTNLTNVILSHNQLISTNTKTFHELPRLRNIVLLGNQLKIVRSKSFTSCPLLSSVVLSHNQLLTIEPAAFHNLTRLTSVFLQFNKLSRFSFNIFSGVSNSHFPMYINVSNNRIVSLVLSHRDESDHDIRTLDLSHNNISLIPEGFFKCVERSLYHLFLSFNNLTVIPSSVFSETANLQVIHLDHNHITSVKSTDFRGKSRVQIITLGYNNISTISSEAFTGLQELRIVDLSYNRIATLPESAFMGTKLERINLSHNIIVRPPLRSFFPARYTLRIIDLSANHISVIQSDEINPLYMLYSLNLSSNRLTEKAVGFLVNLTRLINLDVSHNPLRRIEDGPFYPLRLLRSLNLKNSSLSHLSFIPLLRLRTLTLANNLLRNISDHAFRHLRQLRHLDLSYNLIEEVPSHVWVHTPDLHTLDISHNPIEVLGTVSFSGLNRLVELDMRGLDLKYLDSRTLYKLRCLQTFKTSTYPGVRSFRLHDLLHKSASLVRVVVEVKEPTLSHQIQWTFGAKLRDLTITGHNLQHVLPDAFLGLHHTHELILRITGTGITRLPHRLLRYLTDIRYLTLDLRENNLKKMEPRVLEPGDGETGEPDGTKHIAGGVLLENNPWTCDCDLIWLSHWLRRWMRETLQVQMLHFDAALYVYNLARQSTCKIPGSNTEIPVIDLRLEEMKCTENQHNTAAVISLHLLGPFVIWGLAVLIGITDIYI
ncbi:chaoptin-like [Limulus polyphemus]|uniref:Chaoptin-like n=1 Tax=Limulus polyphemus TaxID=6850 RepID=A0ABM1SR46_LIMPO|nr:chaoptin-like [Limulus polyphemus]